MSFLSNVMRAVVNPATIAQLAMGPAGWASLAVKVIVSAVGQQVIEQLGQKLGLPQGAIDLAKQAFTAATGTGGLPTNLSDGVSFLAQQGGLSATQTGELSRAGNQFFDGVNKIVERLARRIQESEQGEASGTGGTTGGRSGSVLMRIAQALGELMDNKMDAMAAKGEQLGKLGDTGSLTKDGNFNAKGQSQYGKVSGEMQALGQELSILSQALSNTLKSIGEASTTLARKG